MTHPADRERPRRRLLDLFCGRWGWSRAFAARGWECVGVDLVQPHEIPEGCHFWQFDVLTVSEAIYSRDFDAIIGSGGQRKRGKRCHEQRLDSSTR